MRFAVVALCFVSSIVCAAGPARADARAEAESAFRVGAAAYKDQQYVDAAAQFELAYSKLPAPEIAFSAAQAHRLALADKDGKDPVHLQRAVALYRAYLDQAPTGSRAADATDHLGRLEPQLRALDQAQLDQLKSQAARSRLLISVEAPDASATVDGKPAMVNQYQDVSPGAHTIVISAPGHAPMTLTRTVNPGDPVPVQAMLSPLPARLTLRGLGAARVAVDGRPVLVSRGTLELAHGRRYLTASGRGRLPLARELDLRPGQVLELDAHTGSTGQRKAAWFALAGAGALGVATIAAGTMTWIRNGQATDLRDAQPLQSDQEAGYEAKRASRDRWRSATIGFGTGAALIGAAGAVLYLFDTPSAEAAPLVPAAGAGADGGFTPMSVDGGFGLGYGGGF